VSTETPEQPKKPTEPPEKIFRRFGRQDAESGLPSRHEEIEEHFRAAYLKGYQEAQQDIQQKMAQAAMAGRHLQRR
jgi:hypothetical protein